MRSINAGIVLHKGVEYKAETPGIFSPDEWATLQVATQLARSKSVHPGRFRKHMLNGLVYCGKRGAKLVHKSKQKRDKTYITQVVCGKPTQMSPIRAADPTDVFLVYLFLIYHLRVQGLDFQSRRPSRLPCQLSRHRLQQWLSLGQSCLCSDRLSLLSICDSQSNSSIANQLPQRCVNPLDSARTAGVSTRGEINVHRKLSTAVAQGRRTLLALYAVTFLGLSAACGRPDCDKGDPYSVGAGGCTDPNAPSVWEGPAATAFGAFLLYGVICGCISAAIASGRDRSGVGFFFLGLFFGLIAILAAVIVSPGLPKAPAGTASVNCPRCGANQNVNTNDASYECWQCKLISHSPVQSAQAKSFNVPQPSQTVPGWYPDPHNPGNVRYHDGQQWR